MPLSEWVACNASNAVRPMAGGAAEKAVPRHNGFVTRTHAGGTAYGPTRSGRAVAPGRPTARRFLEAFSHPRPVEASRPRPRPAPVPALGRPALGPGPARPDLGLRRLLPRAVRDRPRLRRR